MAQGKVVDYQLLKEAGYAAHMEAPEAKKSFWVQFLEMGSKYLEHTKQKTDDLISAMPEIDIAKVDEKMLPMTNDFLRIKRDEIVEASKCMAFYGSTSTKGKACVDQYNKSSAAIVNLNKSLSHLQEEIKWAFENPNLGNEVSVFDAADHNDFANKTVYDKISKIDENGNIFWNSNGTMKVDDGEGNLVEVPRGEQNITDRKRSSQYDPTLGTTWQTFITGVRQQKTNKNKDSELNQIAAINLGEISTFVNSLKTPNQVVGFMYNERSAINGQLYIDKFITNSIEEGGLGIDKDADPDLYNQLYHDLKDGNWKYTDENGDEQTGDMKNNLTMFLTDDANDAWDHLTENLPTEVKQKPTPSKDDKENQRLINKQKDINKRIKERKYITASTKDGDTQIRFVWKEAGSKEHGKIHKRDGTIEYVDQSGWYMFKLGEFSYAGKDESETAWIYVRSDRPHFRNDNELAEYMHSQSKLADLYTLEQIGWKY